MKGLSSQTGAPDQWEVGRVGGQSSVRSQRRQGFSHRVSRIIARKPAFASKSQRNWGLGGSGKVREATQSRLCAATAQNGDGRPQARANNA